MRLVYALMVLALTACAGATVERAGVPGPSPAVTVPIVNGDLAAANVEAANYCRAQGRTAQLLARYETSVYYNCQK